MIDNISQMLKPNVVMLFLWSHQQFLDSKPSKGCSCLFSLLISFEEHVAVSCVAAGLAFNGDA